MILAAGANVILCSKGIDDMALKYFVEAGAIACRRVNRDDLRRIAKATGAQVMMSLSDMDGGETFDESMLGTAGEVVEQRVADDDMVVIKESANNQACTILLRGANDYMLDEIGQIGSRRFVHRETNLRERQGCGWWRCCGGCAQHLLGKYGDDPW